MKNSPSPALASPFALALGLDAGLASPIAPRQAAKDSKPSVSASQERQRVAQDLLLAPFGLDENHLQRVLAEITQHQVDDADLYFQTTRSEGWSLEEGIVKTGSFSIDQGVGVRAVSGEKTAFAYSDDISWASLLDAARTVRTITAAMSHGRDDCASSSTTRPWPSQT